VPKVQHKPIKRSKLGLKRKEQKKPKRTLVWRTGQCPVTRAVPLQTCHLREIGKLLRYNSPDCPVHQAKQRLPAQRSTSTVTAKCYSAQQCATESERRVRAHRTLNSSCPVWQRTVRCTKMLELQRSKLSEP
jgi:hypothetical protein